MSSTSGDAPRTSRPRREVYMAGSSGLWDWLSVQRLSLAFTTYQSNRLFLLGCKADGQLAVNERLFDKPMGLCADGETLYMTCRYQIWQLDNRLAPGEEHRGSDRLYVPSLAHTTGDLNVHEIALTKERRLVFLNTDFSCLATLRTGFSFEPVWQPPFISRLAAEDRCHLNGLALENGEIAYATACSETDTAAGWRDHRVDGGIVMHVPTNRIVARGLSMPHSPRLHGGRLWVLNSGSGELGYIEAERFQPVAFLPGFVRGLAFHGDYAVIGMSKLRSKTFGGLALEKRLAEAGQSSQCGLGVVDLKSGAVVHGLEIQGVVEELFDVVVLPEVRQPSALGFQDDDIDRLVTFPGSNGLVMTKPTVARPGKGRAVQKAGVPRPSQSRRGGDVAIRYQRVFHLNPENLLAYEDMTQPSLKARWQTRPQRGELLGVSASLGGEMIGLAVAERFTASDDQAAAELISLKVLPDYGGSDIEANLVKHLQKLVGAALTR